MVVITFVSEIRDEKSAVLIGSEEGARKLLKDLGLSEEKSGVWKGAIKTPDHINQEQRIEAEIFEIDSISKIRKLAKLQKSHK